MNETISVDKVQIKERLANDLQVLMTDAEQLLKLTLEQKGQHIDEIRSRMNDSLNRARAELKLVGQRAEHRRKETAEMAEHYVQENPFRAVGIAAGVGLVIGLLIGRR